MTSGARTSRRGGGLAATAATAALVVAGAASLVLGLDVGAAAPERLPLSTAAVEPGPPTPERALARAGLPAPAPPAPAPPAAARPAATPVLPASAPLRLVVPAIGVDSGLLRLGQQPDGTLEVPPPGPTYDSAGWYEHSPTPGELGPAVLAGHVDSAADGPSVFFRLAELTAGDAILVDRADGGTAVFRVDDVRRYGKADFPTAAVYGDTAHAALRLITCGGRFDRASGHYVDNIVVTASLIGG